MDVDAVMLDAKLGLRLWEVLKETSDSVPPKPIDFRCPLPPLFADIGGYWFCLRVRIASGAVGGSMLPGTIEDVDDRLLCRFEVLCLLKSEPLRTGLEIGAPRPAKPFASIDRSGQRIEWSPTHRWCLAWVSVEHSFR